MAFNLHGKIAIKGAGKKSGSCDLYVAMIDGWMGVLGPLDW
jgi:hypothetical protein